MMRQLLDRVELFDADGNRIVWQDGRFWEIIPSVTVGYNSVIEYEPPSRLEQWFGVKPLEPKTIHQCIEVKESEVDALIESLEAHGHTNIQVFKD